MHPGVLMFIAHRAGEARVMQAVADAGYDDVTLAQARLLARVPEDGIRLTRLAESAQVTKQTAGFLVGQLEKAGYAERVPDPADGRARLIRLAPRAREVQKVARRVEAEVLREWTDHLGEERMKVLQETLEALRTITDPFLD